MLWRALLVTASAITGLAGGGLGGGSGYARSTSAQLATPAASVDAVGCTVAARNVEDVLALLAAEPGLVGMRQTLPKGRPVDAATAEAIARAVRELEACANAGDVFQFLALFTDAALRQRPMGASQEAKAELAALAAATPTPLPAGHLAVFAGPWRLEVLPDGRVLAAVVWFGSEADPCVDPNRITVLLFAQQGGRWLIDERIERVAEGELIDLVGPPPAATAETVVEACVDSEPERGPNDD